MYMRTDDKTCTCALAAGMIWHTFLYILELKVCVSTICKHTVSAYMYNCDRA